MRSPYLSGGREAAALADVAATSVSRTVAWTLVVVLLATLAAVPVAEVVLGIPHPALSAIPSAAELIAIGREEGALAANRRLLRSMHAVEDSLDRESVLVRYLLPSVQTAMTRWLDAGNEQVVPGRGDWLFFVPDVEHVSGPPFLDRAVQRRRALAGDEREARVEPDPLVAIEALAAELDRRGMRLLLLPVPVKPMLHPERLTRRGEQVPLPLENPSWAALLARLEYSGVETLDVGPALAAARAGGEDELFLHTDTHWTPAAMDQVAALLAAAIEPHLDRGDDAGVEWRRHEVLVAGTGDLIKLLDLPRDQQLFPPQTVRVSRVEDSRGKAWASDPRAQVLLLGDSFANVYGDADLGWGVGAGLAEQLSFHLERPVERLADNGGGARGARQRLAQDLAHGIDRLEGKRVVVYEFAMRDLSSGDWQAIDLEPGAER